MNRSRRAERPWIAALLIYLAAIFIVSGMPGPMLQKVGFSIWDKGAHLLEYALLGFISAGWLQARTGRHIWPFSRLTLWAVGWIAFAGASDEIHQVFVPTRTASVFDLLADILGGVMGMTLAWLFFRNRRTCAEAPAVDR